jgi:hypothetical protein
MGEFRSSPTNMPPDLPEKTALAQRDRVLRVALLALAIGLFVAFWMVCSQQVRKAQMRDVTMQVQRVAIGDCLQYVPRATLNSCASRVDPYSSNAAITSGDKPASAADAARALMGNSAAPGAAYR